MVVAKKQTRWKYSRAITLSLTKSPLYTVSQGSYLVSIDIAALTGSLSEHVENIHVVNEPIEAPLRCSLASPSCITLHRLVRCFLAAKDHALMTWKEDRDSICILDVHVEFWGRAASVVMKEYSRGLGMSGGTSRKWKRMTRRKKKRVIVVLPIWVKIVPVT